jgi:hypothetical protein
LIQKSKTISEQTAKTTKYCIEKNPESISNVINLSHGNRSEHFASQNSSQSKKSKTRSENVKNEHKTSHKIKSTKFSIGKLK